MKKIMPLIFIMLVIGFSAGALTAKTLLNLENLQVETKTYRGFNFVESLATTENTTKTLTSEVSEQKQTQEVPSPQDRIKEQQIHVYQDKVVIEMENCQWAKFSDTNSMDPVFDSESNAIEIVPNDPKMIKEGDIASYSLGSRGTIIHRVIETGYDEDGWYAIFKGDNNPKPDPDKVRWEQIRRLVVAIIY